MHSHVLIISDIEGSTGCGGYAASRFMTREWAAACRHMSHDVNAVVTALFDAGVLSVTVKDFHRTAYNLLPELIDRRARIVCGYRSGPVPGIGDPGDATALVMTGMHAPSGSGGFLAHTLTSRLSSIRVNGHLMGEAELFSASLAPMGIAPVFFSGCPVACRYTQDVISGIHVFPVVKDAGGAMVDNIETWRDRLGMAAARAVREGVTGPFTMTGPFQVRVTFRDGEEVAARTARRWKLALEGDAISFSADDFDTLYGTLIRICYLTPVTEKVLPLALPLYDMAGRMGRMWARRRSREEAPAAGR